MFKRKKVGLVLGSGGARGMAHIGVLKILEENDIHIDFISGTSIGALIGACYSAEPNIKKIEKDISSEPWRSIFDYNILPNKGLIKGNKIKRWMDNNINGMEFKDLRIPLYVTAFDLISKREVIFSRGDVSKAVCASIAIPGIFVPVENNGMCLVDGGIIDPIPSEILSKVGADIIIAVNVNTTNERVPLLNEVAVKERRKKNFPNILQVISESTRKQSSKLSEHDLKDSNIDLVIDVKLENIGTLDFNKFKIAIEAGEKATRENLHKIKKLVKRDYIKTLIDKINKKTKLSEIVNPIEEVSKKIEKVIE